MPVPLSLIQLRKKLHSFACPEKHVILTSFFKCGPGEYGEGDEFLGVTVPQTRTLIQSGLHLSFRDIETLLKSRIHEERLLGLFILCARFGKGAENERKKIYRFYMKNRSAVNNWDLVDASAHKIVGAHLENQKQNVLIKLARSPKMWDRRIAIVATWHFIRAGELETTFELTRMLLTDKEDLMHKACGWMLREAGKKNRKQLEAFLGKHAHEMPRTMLRYAIEKFNPSERARYLKVRSAGRLAGAQTRSASS